MMPRIAGLVLAGGRARRMGGGDKPLLTLQGHSMLQRIVSALAMEDVAISANGDPARYQAFGLPILDDGAFSDHGPLAGVLAGLDWAAGIGAEVLLTVPGDTPFVPPDLAARLLPAPACAASSGHVHHLVALWPVASRDVLRSLLLADGPRRVSRFAEMIGARIVDFTSDGQDPFFNVNTPEDLVAARERTGQSGAGGRKC